MVFSSLDKSDTKFPLTQKRSRSVDENFQWWKLSDSKHSNISTRPGLRDEEIQQMGEEQVEMLAPNPRQDFWDR